MGIYESVAKGDNRVQTQPPPQKKKRKILLVIALKIHIII